MADMSPAKEPMPSPAAEASDQGLRAANTGNPDELLTREWLVTNGLGGYASSSLLGIATRRYHGVFVPHLPLRGRTVMVPRLDVHAETASGTAAFSGAEYADGRLDAEVAHALHGFRREWQTPVWTFHCGTSRVEQRLVMPYRQNTVYVQYRLLEGDPVRLSVRPFVTCRLHDAKLSGAPEGPFPLTAMSGRFEIAMPGGAPALKVCLRPARGVFVVDERRSEPVSYRTDRDRGSEHVERLFSPGYFITELQPDESVAFVASVEPWEWLEMDAEPILVAERQRLSKIPLVAELAAEADDFALQLALASDQFIVVPGSRPGDQALARAAGDDARTVIAGYHWFADWGRDTMISLDGLALCTGRHREGRAVLQTFAQYVRDGLIPNMFPEGAREGLYHTVDATLWYFHAIDRYVSATGDFETVKTLFPILKEIVLAHREGTRFGIGVDPYDGLVHAGQPGYQLTWMDAKVEEWVVTPRQGKPVEVQALWYNALRLMAQWGERLDEAVASWLGLAAQAEASFHERFWYEPGGYLYDVVDGKQGRDASLRPNQIVALALRHPILRQERWAGVVDVVTKHLLTPYGLRSLAPGHRHYKPTYSGDLRARDAAYHQGTVWAWLIGPYIDARLRVDADKRAACALLDGFRSHLREAGIGTISEIFDAEAPFQPRGCIAQAWSVAEVLRAYSKTALSDQPSSLRGRALGADS